MPDPRGLLVSAAGGRPGRVIAAGLERFAPWRRGALTILTYHRVEAPTVRPDLMASLVSATPAAFVDQMALLAERYRPISLAEALAGLSRPADLPPRAVLVTFDDAYADFATNAWPAMRSSGVPATLFVPTGLVGRPGRPFWWDRLWAACASPTTGRDRVDTPVGSLAVGSPTVARASVKALRGWLKDQDHDVAMRVVADIVAELGEAAPEGPALLDLDALRRLAADGVTLAPHTQSHPLLDRVPFDRAVAEIAGSLDDLRGWIGDVPPVLAYPSGAHGGRAVEAARAAGMAAAVTTVRGGNDLRRADPFRLRRINVGGRTPLPAIRSQLVWASTVDARLRRPRDPSRGPARDR